MKKKSITILGIETSCDETAASLLKAENGQLKIISNIVASQIKVHTRYGGIVPEVAARKHAEKIIFVLRKALKFKIFNLKPIDAIGVTVGPGLITSLLVGVEAARTLAFLFKKPLIPLNHLLGHIYANFIDLNPKFYLLNPQKLFPAVCLVVSGGHTELILMRGFEKFQKIGQTLDDAAGECFDKVAKILGLGYPGGPAIAREAAKLQNKFKIQNTEFKIELPRPMINSSDFNFSFSGLKTAVLYKIKDLKLKVKDLLLLPLLCTEVQQAIIDVLTTKTIRAIKVFKAKSVILGGGVTANNELRKQIKLKIKNLKLKTNLLIPAKNLCTDNAAMMAAAGYFKLKKTPQSWWLKKFDWRKIKVDPNLEI
ncbi:MAG: tRNA (adenosine(37)-N6)-threonylcarbamoyltransferase complex transferase subunit TsaD [Patescibacteria group bacterium]|nr:tRNA (adenosine(37)-N6)-threonylcarbamoyltransferase complex transferase subunit TsaD [Patescibacteria group bacterium]